VFTSALLPALSLAMPTTPTPLRLAQPIDAT
jgi:hypothetical protein